MNCSVYEVCEDNVFANEELTPTLHSVIFYWLTL